ncbi:PsbP-related protein [Brevibacillus porteri]|uniref:PsbP-related protein n=1 Tax=Brevibacillus porteri TaxID=2126350 RepID=UPI003D1D8088
MNIPRHLRSLIQYFFAVLFLLGCSQTNEAVEATAFKEYKNKKFSISYPLDWAIVEDPNDGSVVFNSPKESDEDFISEHITVMSTTLPDEVRAPMETYKNDIIETMKKRSPGLEVQNTTNLTVNGLSALEILLKGKRDNVNIALRLTVAAKGKTAFVVGFGCLDGDLDKYASTIDKVTNSFKVLD